MQEFNLRESTSVYESSIPLDSLFDQLHTPDVTDRLQDLIYRLSPFKPIAEQALHRQLIWGGFPELLQFSSEDEKILYLNNYLQTYLEKDVRAIETITDINLYHNMMDILAEQTGSMRDDKRVTDSLRCTRDTFKKYRGYLEATLFYQDIYPFIGSSLKRLIKSPKGYLLSNGLISILTGLTDAHVLEKTGMIGHRLESWFLNELNTWGARLPVRHRIHYWRTSSGREVDFILLKKPHIFPFEITYQTQVDQKKVNNLKVFLQEEPKAVWGYYVYRGDFKIDYENKIIFIPCWVIA
jgi:predicted AAA+ superfamily ATPase